MANVLKAKRGTRLQLDAAAAANQLIAGELYLIIDEGRFAIGVSDSVYTDFAKTDEAGGTKGTAVLNFGTIPGSNVATSTVLESNVLSDSAIQVFIQSDSTATHNEEEHNLVPFELRASNIVNNISFDIVATTDFRLTGTFQCHYVIT